MNAYTEHTDSQEPAIDLLQKMGYQYLSAEAIVTEREEIRTNVLWETILASQLAKISDFEYRGDAYKFSQSSIQSAFDKLYGYTSNEGGIRHALMEGEAQVGMAEARFMIVTCSAFVNYLILKYAE